MSVGPVLAATPSVMSEARNNELAAELLDVVNEAELEAFVDRIVADTARRTGGRLGSTARSALVADLRTTAERTLPALSVALGAWALPPAPDATEAASRTFDIELEGMSPEDRDFEIARRFVRLAQAEAVRALESAARS